MKEFVLFIVSPQNYIIYKHSDHSLYSVKNSKVAAHVSEWIQGVSYALVLPAMALKRLYTPEVLPVLKTVIIVLGCILSVLCFMKSIKENQKRWGELAEDTRRIEMSADELRAFIKKQKSRYIIACLLFPMMLVVDAYFIYFTAKESTIHYLIGMVAFQNAILTAIADNSLVSKKQALKELELCLEDMEQEEKMQ